MTCHIWDIKIKNPHTWGSVSARGLEPPTNGLKGRCPQTASPIQELTRFAPVYWTSGEESLLDTFFKGLSTQKHPMDLLHICLL